MVTAAPAKTFLNESPTRFMLLRDVRSKRDILRFARSNSLWSLVASASILTTRRAKLSAILGSFGF